MPIRSLKTLLALAVLAASTAAAAPESGPALVRAYCSGCHRETAPGQFERISAVRKTPEGWVRVPATTDWPADLAPTGGKRMRPGNTYACFEAELVAMLRAIELGEPFPVTGDQAAGVQAAIEQAYQRADPIDCSWLSPQEQAAAKAKHWRAVASA